MLPSRSGAIVREVARCDLHIIETNGAHTPSQVRAGDANDLTVSVGAPDPPGSSRRAFQIDKLLLVFEWRPARATEDLTCLRP
jgi:hypothetical protein